MPINRGQYIFDSNEKPRFCPQPHTDDHSEREMSVSLSGLLELFRISLLQNAPLVLCDYLIENISLFVYYWHP